MNHQELLEHWKKDAPLDPSELGQEAANAPKLHWKYLGFLTEENLRLKFLESKYKKLKLQKWEHYTQGPSKETAALGWKVPAIGKILNANVPMYLDADEDLQNEQLRIDAVKEKIAILEKILAQINGRSYLIGHCIADLRWKGGN
jgi:hypothetical protein